MWCLSSNCIVLFILPGRNKITPHMLLIVSNFICNWVTKCPGRMVPDGHKTDMNITHCLAHIRFLIKYKKIPACSDVFFRMMISLTLMSPPLCCWEGGYTITTPPDFYNFWSVEKKLAEQKLVNISDIAMSFIGNYKWNLENEKQISYISIDVLTRWGQGMHIWLN